MGLVEVVEVVEVVELVDGRLGEFERWLRNARGVC